MCWNNGWGGNGCLWIILILILICCCGCGTGGNSCGCGCNNNNCGCGNNNNNCGHAAFGSFRGETKEKSKNMKKLKKRLAILRKVW